MVNTWKRIRKCSEFYKCRKDNCMTLSEERRELEEQKRTLEREKKAFSRHVEMENRRIEQQKNLFDTKFRILEEEMIKVAEERVQMEKKKAYYDMLVDFYVNGHQLGEPKVVSGELFFRGVANQQSLKKRYKDLLKIYHPDNADGDNSTVIEINKEYQQLCQVLV